MKCQEVQESYITTHNVEHPGNEMIFISECLFRVRPTFTSQSHENQKPFE